MFVSKTMEEHPPMISAIAVQSNFQTHFSPSKKMDKIRFAMIASEEFAARRVRSAYGSAITCIVTPESIIMKPSHHILECK